MTTISIMANTQASLHQAVVEIYRQAKEAGGMWQITATTVNDRKRIAMRAALHGHILPAIALQARVFNPRTGMHEHWSPKAWKELARELFIAPVIQEYVDGKTGEVRTRVLRRSTEDLSDDEYQDFLLMVQSWAVVDLHVIFPEEPTA